MHLSHVTHAPFGCDLRTAGRSVNARVRGVFKMARLTAGECGYDRQFVARPQGNRSRIILNDSLIDDQSKARGDFVSVGQYPLRNSGTTLSQLTGKLSPISRIKGQTAYLCLP